MKEKKFNSGVSLDRDWNFLMWFENFRGHYFYDFETSKTVMIFPQGLQEFINKKVGSFFGVNISYENIKKLYGYKEYSGHQKLVTFEKSTLSQDEISEMSEKELDVKIIHERDRIKEMVNAIGISEDEIIYRNVNSKKEELEWLYNIQKSLIEDYFEYNEKEVKDRMTNGINELLNFEFSFFYEAIRYFIPTALIDKNGFYKAGIIPYFPAIFKTDISLNELNNLFDRYIKDAQSPKNDLLFFEDYQKYQRDLDKYCEEKNIEFMTFKFREKKNKFDNERKAKGLKVFRFHFEDNPSFL